MPDLTGASWKNYVLFFVVCVKDRTPSQHKVDLGLCMWDLDFPIHWPDATVIMTTILLTTNKLQRTEQEQCVLAF